MLASDICEKQIVVVFEIGEIAEKFIIAATADTVNDVIEISENEIKPVPELGLSFDSKFVAGAVHRDDNFLLMLDVEKLFSNSKIVINL